MTKRYRSIEWQGTRRRIPCPQVTDHRKHRSHGWVRASDLAILDCVGFPEPIPRCSEWRNTNWQCLLDTGHEERHQRPCIDHGAHRAHSEGTPEWVINCGGRRFDAT